MIPVASLDAAMVLAETAEMPLHNLGLIVLDRPRGSAESSYDAMRRVFERSLRIAPAFRRRLVQDPLRLGDLRWIEDPRFDIRDHLLRSRLPAPGGPEELARFVGDYAGSLLDRGKPLWEVVLLEGLASGELAVVAKIHHAAMDGAHLARFIEELFAPTPVGPPGGVVFDPWKPEREPRARELALDAARTLAGKPRAAIRSAVDVGGAYLRSRRARGGPDGGSTRGGRLEVPRTPWQGAISAERAAAFCDVRLADLETIRAAHGTTVNDVVLAAAAGALRRYLLARRSLPEIPLVANVPIAVKRASGEQAGNRVSMLRVHLPTEVTDPVARLKRIHAETARGKTAHHARGSNAYARLADFVIALTVPALLTPVVRFYSSHRGGDLHPVLWNVVISNVRGPRHDLYGGSAKVKRIYPFGPVQHGSGLNLTVMSVGECLCLGALADRARVPDVDAIAAGFVDGVEELLARSRGPA